MYKFFKKFIPFYIVWAIFFSLVNKAKADEVLIIHQNYGGAHTNVGDRLTTEGHTVTYSTSTTLPSTSGYGQIWDLRYNTTSSSDEITALDNFVKNGGFLMMNGENSGFAARNNSIASVVSAAGGGTLTYGSGSNTYTVINTGFSNDTGTVTGAAGSSLINSQGQYVFKTSTGTIGGMIWQSGDLGSGYSGAIFVTADINMWDSTYGSILLKVNIVDDLLDMETATTLYAVSATPTYSSEPTSTQLQKRTDTRNITGSGVYINQIGNNLNLDVIQDGQDNLIAGVNTNSQSTSDAAISGDYNTINLSQKSDNNVLLFGVNGDHNDLIVSQGDNINDIGGHRAIIDITGNYNYTSLTQYNIGYGLGQFSDININGNDNTVTFYQRETNKMLFVDIDGSNNTITTNQNDTGNHFLDITLGSNQTVTATQEGSGDHNATINMGGYTSSLSLTQSGTTDKVYSLEQTCANLGGCATTTINQQ